ncbi:MAG: DUF3293 domain-containing protein [Rhodospirillales bacterium]
MSISSHLRRAYRATEYRAAGLSLRIGRRSHALDGLLHGMGAREAVLITACNPRSRLTQAGRNADMMRRLQAALRRRTAYPAESGAGRWTEAQLLAACPAAWAGVVARRFRQNALVVLRPGQTPRLRVLV